MSSKTRKLIWSVPLMATLAVVGALAVFVALGLPNANPAQAQAPAESPQNVIVSPGPFLLMVQWIPPSNASYYNITGYKVDWKLKTTGTYAEADTASVSGVITLKYTITGLSNDKEYNVRVSAVNADGASTPAESASEGADRTPGTVAPGAPTSVTATSIGSDTVTITWVAPTFDGGASISDYRVTKDGSIPKDDLADSTTSHTFVGLESNITYVFKVAARNSKGVGAEGMVSVTTKRAATVTSDAAKITGFSSSPNGKADLRLDIPLTAELPISGSVVLFLEDDFQVPDTISPNDVFFSSVGTGSFPTGDGALTRAARVVVDSDDYDHVGVDAHTIRVYLPDMNPADNKSNGVKGGKPGGKPGDAVTVTLRIAEEAGIRNDTQAGTYEVAYQVLAPAESINKDFVTKLAVNTGTAVDSNLVIDAKVALSDENNKRDYELTITSSGLNSGREATAYVLKNRTGSMPSCETVIADGASVGSATVGSDHTAVVVDTVITDDYSPGKTNYICIVDDNSPTNRMTTVKQFEMEASVAASPAEVNSGDEVTVKIRDFENFDSADDVISVELAGDKVWTSASDDTDAFVVMVDVNDKELTFDMPGGVSGNVEINVEVGTASKSTSKQTTITVSPSSLTLSNTEVAPNQAVVISGSGFSERAKILTSMILIDGKMLEVDDAGTEGTGDDQHVVTTSSGQFTATVNVWHDGMGNPALDDGEYTIKVTDENGYEGKTKITISEPTVMVTPLVAGPRDFITISGANWPVTTSDDDHEVDIMLDGKDRSARIDSTGRFNYEYQLSGGIDIGAEHEIEVTFDGGTGGDIEEIITFSVPSSDVVITPAMAAPGQTIDLKITGMPIYERVTEVVIDGGNRLGGTVLNTDAEGDVTITGIVIPFADPGFYPVKIVVGTGGSAETAIVQLEILSEASVRGAASPLPESVTDLGDSLVRIFHFNTSSKVWTFYDPREEFEGLNTLTELAAGQPYWIQVSETVENVVLNGRTRNLTCVGGDCWNQLVW